MILFLAVIRVKAIATPLNSAYTKEEFEFYLEDSRSKMLIMPMEGNSSTEREGTTLGLSVAASKFCFDNDRNASIELHPRSKFVASEGSGEVRFSSHFPRIGHVFWNKFTTFHSILKLNC